MLGRSSSGRQSKILDSKGRPSRNHGEMRTNLANYFRTLAKFDPVSKKFSLQKLQSVRAAMARIKSMNCPHTESLDTPFNEFEVQAALKNLKNGAPGLDGIPNDLLKICFSDPSCTPKILTLLNLVWKHETFLQLKKPFHKKGSLHNLDNYRGIGLLCTIPKLLERIMTTRLETFVKKIQQLIAREQGGFQKTRGCPENEFILKETVRRSL